MGNFRKIESTDSDAELKGESRKKEFSKIECIVYIILYKYWGRHRFWNAR